MRGGFLALTCIVVSGCGVSTSLYQQQVVRTQELQARVVDLEARLAAEAGRRETIEKVLEDRKTEMKGVLGKHDEMVARGGDLEARLSSCSQREEALRADLDVHQKARAATAAELEKTRAEYERERTARIQELEACRGETAVVRAENETLRQEREKAEREKREKLEEISNTYEGLVEGLKDEVAKGRVTISQLQGRLTVNMLDEILFDSGSAALRSEGINVLSRLGQVLKEVEDKAIVIEGHTDSVPITGELGKRFPTNWELSTARATSVVRYLQENAGVAPERLSATGFGPYRPVADNDSLDGRRRNRRIEIRLVPVEAPTQLSREGEGVSR